MKKKIAVQTLTPRDNYGNLLQAFALQQFLKNLGHDVVLLNATWNYNVDKSFFDIAKYKLHDSIHYLLSKNKRIVNRFIKQNKKISKEFRRYFTDKYIAITHPLTTHEEWSKYIFENKIDVLITGSDQVWRLAYSGPIRRQCFLDYNLSQVKKISYAASLGVSSIDEELKNYLLEYLPSFDAISVRETDSVKLLEEIGFKPEFCLDPTLLFTREDYINFFNLQKADDAFAFAYLLEYDPDDNNLKQFLADSDLKLIIQEEFTLKNFQKGNFTKCSVIEWLQYIYSSRFVITDSFHGMVFSIIFRKPFYIKVNYERGASRFVSLLTQLDLMDRIWDGKKIEHKEIDYDKVYEKIERLKTSSIEFLIKNL